MVTMEKIAEDRLEEHLIEECAALEAVAGVLAGPGSAQEKCDHALELLQERLLAMQAVLGAKSSGEVEPLALGPTRQEKQEKRNRRRLMPGTTVALVGDSAAMRVVFQAIRRVSQSQATVLLRGESGTGKELVARAIHLQSPRAAGPFVPLHCAAVTETLLESELFGHERGAFTGAADRRKGRFELADGGTLFLDEIGDIPLATQVKLLRVLQEKCFERVGGMQSLSVDVRVIAATHRDLEAMVRAGTFREDLYYRLNVVPIELPPLRERREDIPLLIHHFLARVNQENGRAVTLGHDLLALMARYHWPGNVRELQNCVERLVVMADPDQESVTLESIPAPLRTYFADMKQVTGAGAGGGGMERPESRPLSTSLQAIERERLLEALKRTGWIQARAARALGLTPRQVAYKMRKYGISETEAR